MAAATPTSPADVTGIPLSGLNRIDGLLDDSKWGDALGTGYDFTYSFQTVASVYSEDFNNGYGDPDLFPQYEPWNTAPPLSAAQIAGIEAALAAWESVADVTFTKVTDSDTVAGEIRFGTTAYAETYAHAYLPAATAYAGDIWFGTWDPGYDATLEDTVPGGYGYVTFLHEIGHALGLDHPHDGIRTLQSALDFRDYTVMSYRDYVNGPLSGAFETDIFPLTLMVGDIAAIQYLYGPNMATAAGDDTYSWAVDELIFETIWDAGGTDLITWSGHTDAAFINLTPGQYSDIGPGREVAGELVHTNLGIAYGATIENATGGSGNDTLIGNDTENILTGGLGDDSLQGSGGSDTLSGGGGTDIAFYDDSPAAIVVNLATGIASDGFGSTDSLLSVEGAIGGAGNDSLIGDTGAETLGGGAGNDTLSGLEGGDSLIGGLGVDTLLGGTGDDTYSYDGSDSISEAGGDGTDLVRSSVSYTLPSPFEHLSLTGSAALSATGNTGANVITGNSGHNVLAGLGGNDTLIGGLGDDTYLLGDSDEITEGPSAGNDLVRSAIDYTLGANLEELTLLDGALTGTGNSAANLLLGNAGENDLLGEGGNDTLSGFAGDDSLAGGAGADSLVGGAGVDSLAGGTGSDVYVIDSLGDQVIELAAAGNDVARSSIHYTLDPNLEQLVLTGSAALNGTGNDIDNVITGNPGANALSGLAGNDTLAGADGSDTMLGGEGADSLQGQAGGDEMRGNAGADTLRGGAQADDIRGGQDGDQLYGGSDGDFLAGALGNDFVRGALGNDTVGGGQGNDTVGGGQGDDELRGGLGNDDLTGGLGADIFVFAAAGSADADLVHGFSATDGDLIHLDSAFFSALAPGALSAAQFQAAIFYSGAVLSYDADGAGAGAGVMIATFEGAPALDQTQIFIV